VPAAKIVIDINTWNPCLLGAAFQGCNLFGHGEGTFQQGSAVRKSEIIDDINEEKSDGGVIEDIAM
jgi:hypothetical protein